MRPPPDGLVVSPDKRPPNCTTRNEEELQIATWKTPADRNSNQIVDSGIPICNLQFAMCNVQCFVPLSSGHPRRTQKIGPDHDVIGISLLGEKELPMMREVE